MLSEIILALIQAATEFLPVSSSGHLAIFSNLFSEPDLFFFTVLHLASLIAVIIFTRHEIADLITFKKEIRSTWLYLIIATIPAAAVGYFFNGFIESTFSSYLFLAIAFAFTGIILILTRYTSTHARLTSTNAGVIGLFQALALFPGISRSGMTISAARFMGIHRERAAKFSFLLLIPLVCGAIILESGAAYISIELIVSFVVALFASLLFLNILMKIINAEKFWLFGLYCFAMALVSLVLWLF